MLSDPNEIMGVDRAREVILDLPHTLFATYVLWDADDCIPIYVGTAKTRGRLVAHLKKDSVRDGKIGHTHVNPPFYDYVLSKEAGWFGMTLETFPDADSMKGEEIRLIALYRRRADGGTLFNRRKTG